jgi:hypothetical protein
LLAVGRCVAASVNDVSATINAHSTKVLHNLSGEVHLPQASDLERPVLGLVVPPEPDLNFLLGKAYRLKPSALKEKIRPIAQGGFSHY